MKKQNIYLLNSCNEWKERSSMSLVAATTSTIRLKNIIIAEIKNYNMVYKNEEFSNTKQIRELRDDWENEGLNYVADNLIYGHIETVCDGEIQ